MTQSTIKKSIFAFLFLVLLAPITQQCLPFITSGKLFGYYTNAPDVVFSFSTWLNGTYQKGKSDFCNDHVGFRPDLLRTTGQIDYSLFRKPNYGGTMVGEDDYLFYNNYIWAYYGKDYAGYGHLQQQMLRLKALQDTFASMGKSLVMVYAPCKAWYCGERITGKLKPCAQQPNNYKTCVRLGDSLGVNQVDLNALFLHMKDTTKELLYSKQGIHWTNYGSILGFDSVVRYIEKLRHIRLPHPYWNKVLHTTQAQDPDKDMGNILNLIWPIAEETFCYPELHFTHDSGMAKINAIHIGDSYNINLIRTGMMQNVYSEWQFWFSFKYIFNRETYDKWVYPKVTASVWTSEIKKADCIILLNTPMNTNNIARGFIDSAYNYYFPGK